MTLVENPKNEIMVVDGPPGTGKSYTITALVYHAAERGKSVVVTSHKQQALDVIDDALTEQFQKLHPQAKPSVLRLNKGKQGAGVNNLRNTLSQQAVNAAHRRSSEINAEAVDSDRERLLRQVDETYMAFLKSAEREESTRMQLLEWAKALDELYDEQEGFAEPPSRFSLDTSLTSELIHKLSGWQPTDPNQSLPYATLEILSRERETLPAVLQACERCHQELKESEQSLEDLLQPVPEGWRELQTSISSIRPMFKEASCPFQLFAGEWTFDGIPETSGCASGNLAELLEKAKEWEVDVLGRS